MDHATLSGTVTDQQGKVLPEGHISAQQENTGLERNTVSSSDGSYAIPELPIGRYTVTVDHRGFEATHFTGVQQTTGHTSTLNVSLDVAAAGTEQVKVSAAVEG